jgi:hypothetical protein
MDGLPLEEKQLIHWMIILRCFSPQFRWLNSNVWGWNLLGSVHFFPVVTIPSQHRQAELRLSGLAALFDSHLIADVSGLGQMFGKGSQESIPNRRIKLGPLWDYVILCRMTPSHGWFMVDSWDGSWVHHISGHATSITLGFPIFPYTFFGTLRDHCLEPSGWILRRTHHVGWPSEA